MSITLSVAVTMGAGGNASVAPRLVHFSAKDTTSSETTRPFDEIVYFWDFGDTGSSGSGTWNTWSGIMPAYPRNKCMGPVVAHVYEQSGTFTWRCWAKNLITGTTVNTSGSVTILSADAVYSGTNTICFSNNTDHAGAPSGASLVNSSATWASVIAQAATGKRLLLHAGHSWSATTLQTFQITGNMTIGMYGTGAKPIVNLSTGVGWMQPGGSTGLRLMDIDVNGGDNNNTGGIQLDAIGNLYDFLCLRVDMHDFKNGNGFTLSSDYPLAVSTLFGIVGCDCNHLNDNVSGGGENWAFLCAKKLCILGSSFQDNNSEHIVRIQYTSDSCVAFNRFNNPATQKSCCHLRGLPWYAGSALTDVGPGNYTEYVSFYGNLAQSVGGPATSYFQASPSNINSDHRIRRIVWDSCFARITDAAVNNGGSIFIMACDEFTVRNCGAIIVGDSFGPLGMNCIGLNVGKDGEGIEPAHFGGRVYNFSFFGSISTNMILALVGGDISDFIIRNCVIRNDGAGTETKLNTTALGHETKPIIGATNATPIVVTVDVENIAATAPGHGLTTGDSVVISGVGGNTAANGTRTVTVIDQSTFSLNGITGNGVYTSGGTVTTTTSLTVTEDHNVIDTNSFLTTPALDSDDLQINSTGLAFGAGVAVPVWTDMGQRERPVGTIDAGAWEFGATQLAPTPPASAGNLLVISAGGNKLILST